MVSAWKLVALDRHGSTEEHQIHNDKLNEVIIINDKITIEAASDVPNDYHKSTPSCKAVIDARDGYLRLESRAEDVAVAAPQLPVESGHENNNIIPDVDNGVAFDREGAWFSLRPSTPSTRECILLRRGDRIRLGSDNVILTVKCESTTTSSDATNTGMPRLNSVQVSSSQPASNPPNQIITIGDEKISIGETTTANTATSAFTNGNSHIEESLLQGQDILVDRSNNFTESLLRSTPTPRPSIAAQSDRIEDTPAMDGGRYYDVVATGVLPLTVAGNLSNGVKRKTSENSADHKGSGVNIDGESRRAQHADDSYSMAEPVVMEEATPDFFTPMPSMSTTRSPENVAKVTKSTGVLKSVRKSTASKSPALGRQKTYSAKGRRKPSRTLEEHDEGDRSTDDDADVGAQLNGDELKATEDKNRKPQSESKAMQSPDDAKASVLLANKSKEDEKEDAAISTNGTESVNDKPDFADKKAKSNTEEKKTSGRKRKSPENEATPKAKQKRAKVTSSPTKEANYSSDKENKITNVSNTSLSESADVDKSISPGTPSSRKGRLSSAKTASPSNKKYRAYSGPGLRLVFSNSAVANKPSVVRFLQSKNCTIVDKVSDKGTDVVCIGQGELKKTSKLLLALAYNKRIITDDWVTRSSRAGYLLDPSDFTPSQSQNQPNTTPSRTAKPTSLPLSTSLSLQDQSPSRKNLLAGKSIYFTPALKKEYSKGFAEIQEIVMAVGAKRVMSMPAGDVTPGPHYVVLASENGDTDAVRTLEKKGAVCYSKDLVTTGIVRGELDLEGDEFRIGVADGNGKLKKTRGSKG